MAGIMAPIVEAFATLFNSFGIPTEIATLISTLVIVGTLGLIFFSTIAGFGIPDSGKGYLFIMFFIMIAVLGLIPIWIIVILGLLGIMFIFYQKLMGSDF